MKIAPGFLCRFFFNFSCVSDNDAIGDSSLDSFGTYSRDIFINFSRDFFYGFLLTVISKLLQWFSLRFLYWPFPGFLRWLLLVASGIPRGFCLGFPRFFFSWNNLEIPPGIPSFSPTTSYSDSFRDVVGGISRDSLDDIFQYCIRNSSRDSHIVHFWDPLGVSSPGTLSGSAPKINLWILLVIAPGFFQG